MKRLLLTSLLVLISFPCKAETKDPLCQEINRLEPASADYTPGIDVHGKPVVSADLNNSSAHASPKIIIPLTINLADRYGLILPAGAEMKPEVARIEFDPDGRIIYNGQDITNKVQTICATQTEHGQPPSDSVASTPETTDDGKDVIKGRYPEDMPTYNN